MVGNQVGMANKPGPGSTTYGWEMCGMAQELSAPLIAIADRQTSAITTDHGNFDRHIHPERAVLGTDHHLIMIAGLGFSDR